MRCYGRFFFSYFIPGMFMNLQHVTHPRLPERFSHSRASISFPHTSHRGLLGGHWLLMVRSGWAGFRLANAGRRCQLSQAAADYHHLRRCRRHRVCVAAIVTARSGAKLRRAVLTARVLAHRCRRYRAVPGWSIRRDPSLSALRPFFLSHRRRPFIGAFRRAFRTTFWRPHGAER